MCRWLAYISPSREFLLEDALVTPNHSISRQPTERYDVQLGKYNRETDKGIAAFKERLRRNWSFSIHGLGVAWYSSTLNEFDEASNDIYPVIYKSLAPPLADPSFRSICAGTYTKACFGHIRAVGARTPDEVPILSEYNCHPFSYGRYSFMHNGTVVDFGLIKKEMMALIGKKQADWIKGNTDSEAFAALFFTYLEEKEAARPDDFKQGRTHVHMLAEILKRTITSVINIQKDVTLRTALTQTDLAKLWPVLLTASERERMIASSPNNYLEAFRASLTTDVLPKIAELMNSGIFTQGDLTRLKASGATNGLNLAVTDGHVLVCCRFRNDVRHDQKPASLFYSTTAGRTMHNPPPAATEKYIIVASEQTTREETDWRKIKKNQYIMFDGANVIGPQALGIRF